MGTKRKPDKFILDTLEKYGFGSEALWDCHGTLVIYHKVLEQIAAKTGIIFQAPHIVEAATEARCAAVCVVGERPAYHPGEILPTDKPILNQPTSKIEWSIGEAAPYNNKNAYPWAMAEKRAKDRVILKLIGLHGLVYSEEEADSFTLPKAPWSGPLAMEELRTALRALGEDMNACEELDQLTGLLVKSEELIDQCERDLPEWFNGNLNNVGLNQTIKRHKERLSGV